MVQGENCSRNTLAYEAWADSMEKRYDNRAGQQPSRTEPCTIHRVPDCIRIVDEGAYKPKMLSIGPYHRSNPKLKAMEDHKWHCLRGVLRRYPERRLSYYLKEMEGLEVRVRGFYSENEEIKRIGSKEFVEMMLLDGCFTLELLFDGESESADGESESADGEVNHPIYITEWILPIIRMDMLLLENQLPFLVLEHLFPFVKRSNNSSLVRLAVQFFDHVHVMPIEREDARVDSFHHLLDLFHGQLLPVTSVTSPHSPITVETVPNRPLSIPSATEIQHTWGKLKSKESASSILAVEFSKEDVLEIPYLCINHSTNSIFRNLIAWEQCYPASGNYFTSYAKLMDCLIDTPQDVDVLKKNGIIEHWFGNDEQVVLLFNKMCMGITINFEGSYLYHLYHDVNRFQKKKRSVIRSLLFRDYFKDFLRDPWAILKLEVTVMTIIFTAVQTIITVLSFKR